MSNRALILLDIDGTLLDHDKNLPLSTKKAIAQLQEQGHITAIATGRGPFMFKSLREELNIDSFVSFNGSYVVIEGERIFTNPLNKDKLLQLTTEGLKKDHPAVFMSEVDLQSNVDNHPIINQSLATLKLDVSPSFAPIYDCNKEIYQTLFFIEDDVIDEYQKNYPEFEFVRWHPSSVDVLPKGGSKAIGIQAAIKALNISPDHVYAFGDGLNDVEMLKAVKNSVAMGNGVPEAKEVAKYVTKDVDQDGLVHGLKMIGLL